MDNLIDRLLPVAPPRAVAHQFALTVSERHFLHLKKGDTISIAVGGDSRVYTITGIDRCLPLGQVTFHCELAWERLDHA